MNAQANEAYRLRKLASLTGRSGTIGDVGCAQNPNPWLAADRVIGIDIEPAELPRNYSRSFVGDIDAYRASADFIALDALVAGEILEHVPDPLAFLKSCLRVISPGGRLVLSTPNPNSPIERLLTLTLSRRFFYTDEHIFIFPQRWLIRVLELAGFTEVRLFSGGFPAPGLGLVPFPRPYCYQTIAVAFRPPEHI